MQAVKITLFSLIFSLSAWAAGSDDFIIKVKTDNPGVSADTEFTIPIVTTNGAGYNVDCNNDGMLETVGETGSYTCSYGSAGTYTIRLIDNNGNKKGFRRIQFYINSTTQTDTLKLIDIQQWGTAIWSSMSSAFRDANHTTVSATDVPDLSGVGSLSSMFRNCILADPDTSGWDISNITNLSYMFRDASSANPDVSQWDTSKVKKFQGMFYNALQANPDVSQWDTSSATRMDSMFRHALNADVNVSNWDTGSVTQMNYMFRDTNLSNPDVSRWDTTAVSNFRGMFYNATSADPNTTKNGNIWDTGSATNMIDMFRGASSAHPDVGSWDVSSVSSLKGMFYGATAANPDVANWSTSNVTDMSYMFSGATSAYPDVSQWDTSLVTTFRAMYRGIPSSPDVSLWDTSSVTDMSYMFRDAVNANPDVTKWNTASVTTINSMFRDATAFDQNMSGWDVSNITSAGNFLKGVQLTQANYDALLLSWGSQAVQTGVSFHGGTSQYCSGKSGKDILVNNNSWIIHDGGKNCGGVCASAVGELTENHWMTISFPCSTGSNGIEALIGTAIGGTYGDNDNWVVYEQRGDYTGTSSSMVLLDAADTVEPGKGYWLIADHNTTWHIDGNLTGLSYTPTVSASDLNITSPNFDYVHLRNLPDSASDEQKLLLGNPFPHDINLSDLYFSHAGSAYAQWDDNTSNGNYVNEVVYTYDHVGDDQSAYQAISTSTPGFDKIIHQQGFWLRLKPGQSGTNKLTFPQTK